MIYNHKFTNTSNFTALEVIETNIYLHEVSDNKLNMKIACPDTFHSQ